MAKITFQLLILTYKLISDIRSEINFKHKGLQTLLKQLCIGLIRKIVVIHYDQLCRFAYKLLKYIFLLNFTKLVILFNNSTADKHELSEDSLTINTIFICKLQGRRVGKHRRKRKEKKESVNSEKKIREEKKIKI